MCVNPGDALPRNLLTLVLVLSLFLVPSLVEFIHIVNIFASEKLLYPFLLLFSLLMCDSKQKIEFENSRSLRMRLAK